MMPARILVLCTRRLGDVLLTTPLIRALKRAWPAARIDALTLSSSAAALAGNPDVDRILTLRERAPLRESLRAVGSPRHYDLALSTLYNDRPHLLALWSAGTRANIVPPPGAPGARWKRWLSQRSAALQPVHTVVQYLRLADALGIARWHEVVPPRPVDTRALEALLGPGRAPYAVVHPAPLYAYKAWPLAAWQALIAWLGRQGLRVVVTGGPGAEERAFVARVVENAPAGAAIDASGRLALAELTPLLEGARAYVGPDTSVTHLAAATGVPTVALFGPSNAVVWGPWPQGHAGSGDSPWKMHAPWQQQGNVWLLQGLEHCVPCLLEGCERRLDSRSQCLDELPVARVVAALDLALRRRTAA